MSGTRGDDRKDGRKDGRKDEEWAKDGGREPEKQPATSRRAPDAGESAGADAAAGGRPASLGEMLSAARQRKGLELSDISELTHIRQEYLRALEEARYEDLPEDVYSRNYVRLYAQAVGLDPEAVLDTYARERRRSVGMSTLEERLEKERRGEVPESDRRAGLPFGTLLPTLALVVVLVGLAVWGFNSLLFRPARGPGNTAADLSGGSPSAVSPANPASSGGGPAAGGEPLSGGAAGAAGTPSGGSQSGTTPAGVVGDAVQARTVHVSVATTPPGASVSIDGFALPGTTPIQGVPVTAREGRVVKVTLPGYQPLQQTVDLRQDRDLSYQLAPVAAAAQPAQAAPERAVTPASVSAGQIGINITARTWLEVYGSTSRNQGERLVYATVDAGKHYVFDLPVYLHVGNAAGVDIVTTDKDLGAMGSPGAVVSRAFPAP
ncbi:MAG TPA: RodZ domain-containing protein [Trueperaceae bacterium]|nr:RodZ domain-containing protein [Trueperaceae bacterium]